ncbi:MAG: hypothetical protein ACI8Y4_005000 [Candidatus Poriferisodalaceae bacterium]|jgi:hypothetical protein
MRRGRAEERAGPELPMLRTQNQRVGRAPITAPLAARPDSDDAATSRAHCRTVHRNNRSTLPPTRYRSSSRRPTGPPDRPPMKLGYRVVAGAFRTGAGSSCPCRVLPTLCRWRSVVLRSPNCPRGQTPGGARPLKEGDRQRLDLEPVSYGEGLSRLVEGKGRHRLILTDHISLWSPTECASGRPNLLAHASYRSVKQTSMKVVLQATVIRRFGDERPLEDLHRDLVDLAVEAEQLEFDAMWLLEHHFQQKQWSPSLLPVLGAIADRTSTLRLGTTRSSPRTITRSRRMWRRWIFCRADGLTSSWGPARFVANSIRLPSTRANDGAGPSRSWGVPSPRISSTTTDATSRFPDIRVATKPVQSPMPLWMAAAGTKTIARAGRSGHHYATPTWTKAGEHWDIYAAAAREAGHDPSMRNLATFPVVWSHRRGTMTRLPSAPPPFRD